MVRNPEKIFCLAGDISTGKTTVAEHLAAEFDAHHFRMAKLLAAKAREEGMNTSDYSDSIMQMHGPSGVMAHLMPDIHTDFVNGAHNNITIDGIYRPEDLDVIRATFPHSKLYLIFTSAPRILRIGKLAKREGISILAAKEKIDKWDVHMNQKFNKLNVLEKTSDIKVHNWLRNSNQVKTAISKALKR